MPRNRRFIDSHTRATGLAATKMLREDLKLAPELAARKERSWPLLRLP